MRPDHDPHRTYEAIAHRACAGWYVIDQRTRRVAVVNDRPLTGLNEAAARSLTDTLNDAAGMPARRWH